MSKKDTEEPSMSRSDDDEPDEPLDFYILESGTLSGKEELIDSRGYSYTRRKKLNGQTFWWCTVQNEKVQCKASVIQLGEIFKLGSNIHCHEPGILSKTEKDTNPGTANEKIDLAKEANESIRRRVRPIILQKRKLVEGRLKSVKSIIFQVEANKRKLSSFSKVKTVAVKGKPTTSKLKASGCLETDRVKKSKEENVEEKLKSVNSLLFDFQDFDGPQLEEDSDFEEPYFGYDPSDSEDDESVTYSLIKCKSCGKNRLTDSSGYTYTGQDERKDGTYWWCSERDKSIRCKTYVHQYCGNFKLKSEPHCHVPKLETQKKGKELVNKCCEAATGVKTEESDTCLVIADQDNSPRIPVGTAGLPRFRGVKPTKLSVKDARACGFQSAAALGISISETRTRRGKPMLVDSQGYKYTFKREGARRRLWWCPVRNPSMSCKAFVTEQDNMFKFSTNEHCHIPRPIVEVTPKKRPPVKRRSIERDTSIPRVSKKDIKIEDFEEHEVTIVEDPRENSLKPGEEYAIGETEGFTILENSTYKGKKRLIDPKGHTYTIRHEKNGRIFWWCTVRNKRVYCRATLYQIGNKFRFGPREHIHDPKPLKKAKKRNKPFIVTEDGRTIYRQIKRHSTREDYEPTDMKFRIITEGTRSGRSKLVDSEGYTYTIRRYRKIGIYWWCTVRSKNVNCRAGVLQIGNEFRMKKEQHIHEPVFKTKMKSDVTEGILSPAENEFEIPGDNVTYQIAEKVSSKGVTKTVLMGSDGFFYKLKRQEGEYTYWLCSESSTHHHCGASISQKGFKFKVGKREHCHSPPTIEWMHEDAVQDTKNFSTFKVIQEIAKCLTVDSPEKKPPIVNEEIHHEIFCEEAPNTLHFGNNETIVSRIQVRVEFVPPNFLQKDIYIDDGERHLILALKGQMNLLTNAKMWIIDSTARIVCEPFAQMVTIQTCISVDDQVKHVPAAFILMSRCQRMDYEQVFQVLLADLEHPISLDLIVAPADENIWEAVKTVFPDKRLRGCSYNWGKAVWQKVEELKLKTEYVQKTGSHGFVNKVMALPFLPLEHIPIAFQTLWENATGYESLESLLEFVDSKWISNSVWNLSSWIMFLQPVRVRADVENWYIKLSLPNQRPSFCRLLWHLLSLSKQIPFTAEAVCDEKLLNFQRSNVGSLQFDVNELCFNYSGGNISTDTFLENMGLLYSNEVIL